MILANHANNLYLQFKQKIPYLLGAFCFVICLRVQPGPPPAMALRDAGPQSCRGRQVLCRGPSGQEMDSFHLVNEAREAEFQMSK